MPCPASARPIDCCGSLLPAFANSDAVAVLPFIIAGRGDEAASSLECFAEERLRRYGLDSRAESGQLHQVFERLRRQRGIGTQRIGSRIRVSWNDVTTLTVSVAQTV